MESKYSNVPLDIEKLDEEVYVDLTGIMDELMERDLMLRDTDKYFESNNIVTTKDGKYDIYILNLNFDYSPYADIIEDFSFNAYAFVRE